MDYQERRGSKEYAYPVTIGEDCWIGGGAIYPGVTIGNRCVIGAGSCDERYSRRQCCSRETGDS